jgi:hypothetical protein
MIAYPFVLITCASSGACMAIDLIFMCVNVQIDHNHMGTVVSKEKNNARHTCFDTG